MIYTLRFFLQNAVCFIILNYLIHILFKFYLQDVLKVKKLFRRQKVKYGSVRGIHGPKRDEGRGEWKKLHIGELKFLYCFMFCIPPLNFAVDKIEKNKMTGSVARTGKGVLYREGSVV